MSVSAISGSSIRDAMQQFQAAGGATQSQLSQLQSSSQSSNPQASQFLGNLVSNFGQIDTNGDGKLDASEIKTYEKKTGHAGGGHHHGGGGKKAGGVAEDGLSLDDLTDLDSEIQSSGGDTSKISQLISNFSAADTNQDGKIDSSEFAAFFQQNNGAATSSSGAAAAPAAAAPVGASPDSLASITALMGGSPSSNSSLSSNNITASALQQLLNSYANNTTSPDITSLLQGITA